jgi:hypothetical protein
MTDEAADTALGLLANKPEMGRQAGRKLGNITTLYIQLLYI